MRNPFVTTPVLRSSFSIIAAASSRSRSILMPFRMAQRAQRTAHHDDPMAIARKAFMAQRHMSLCYIPSMG